MYGYYHIGLLEW